MQTTPLPFQISGASPAPAPQRANAGPSADARQFSQALSREMEQHKPSPAPAPAAAQAPAPPPPPANAAAAPAPAPAKVPGKSDTPATGKAGDDDKQDDEANAAALGPVTDMLALVASFNQPVTDPLAASVAAQASALPALAGKAADASSLAAKVPADGKTLPLTDLKQALEGAARFAVKVPGDAAAADATPKDAAAPSLLAAGGLARAATTGATQKPEPDALTGASPKTETPPLLVRAEAAPLRARDAVTDAAVLKEPAAALPVSAPVQQASLAMAQAVTGAPTDRIAARVGTPGWDNQVAQKIVWMVAGKEQSASLTLNPPDMGPMQVVLSVTNDQATVTFSAAQPEVRQALENAMPKLREMMSESGIALGNATVNAGTPDQRQAQQGEQSRSQGGGARFGAGGGDGDAVSVAPTRETRLGGGNGLVDTFA